MNDDEAVLDELAGAVLDGVAVDWDAADVSATLTDRPLVGRLRLIAGIAQAHRHRPLAHIFLWQDAPGTWGPLRLLERVGRGTFGEVYRAWDPRLDREVALKLLPAGWSPASPRASSIIEEGRLLARVRHPNVVTIHGAEQIGDRVGLWMEFVDGRTLHDLVARDGRRFSPTEVEAIGRSLCAAVAAVHGAGLLHRDITARNVMLAGDGRVVLMDFGSGADSAATVAGALAGTPLYLAPELLAGAGRPSVQSDLYSIGVLLYFLLTGGYPVRGVDLDGIRTAHARGERRVVRRPRPSGCQDGSAGRWSGRSGQRPERRYDSATALAAALDGENSGRHRAAMSDGRRRCMVAGGRAGRGRYGAIRTGR